MRELQEQHEAPDASTRHETGDAAWNQASEQPAERFAEPVEQGMLVEATQGDLGTHDDISPPKVTEIERGAGGGIRKLIIEKGLLFKKRLEIPGDRVAGVQEEPTPDGETPVVQVAATEQELDALSPTGDQELPPASELPDDERDSLLEATEEAMPTAEGQRRNEIEAAARRKAEREGQATASASSETTDGAASARRGVRAWLRVLGPGLLAGMSGNDATAVTSYAVNGATAGYGQLWLMLLSTPLYQAVIYACGKVGRVSQMGFTELLRQRYGRKLAVPIALLLFVANIALIAGDLVAIGTGLQLITGLNWVWFVLPVAAILWFLTVYESFGVIKKIFLVMSLGFVAYLVTGFFSHANWGAVLRGTFVPQLTFDLAGVSSAVGLLGATLSPYTMVWQAQGEKEEARPGSLRRQTRLMGFDIATGTISGNLVAYFIILTTSATLFVHHRQITTAADAANALQPLVGPFAKYLFAAGFIGAGLVAIPVLLASTSYALSGAFGWAASLWKKPWQNEGFYLILTVALVVSVVLALVGFNPIQFIFWANVLQGILAPVLLVIVLLVASSRSVMREHRIGWLTRIWLGLAVLVMVAGAALLFYGLLRGQGG